MKKKKNTPESGKKPMQKSQGRKEDNMIAEELEAEADEEITREEIEKEIEKDEDKKAEKIINHPDMKQTHIYHDEEWTIDIYSCPLGHAVSVCSSEEGTYSVFSAYEEAKKWAEEKAKELEEEAKKWT